jgi:hypothetical protein
MGIGNCDSSKQTTSPCITYCKPTGEFLIIEELLPTFGGMPSTGSKVVDFSWAKWVRRVAEICDITDQYIDGEPVDNFSLWHGFKIWSGWGKYVEKPTGKKGLVLHYAKMKNIANLPSVKIPVTNEKINSITEWWNKYPARAQGYTLPTIINYGTDPLPNKLLYNNPNATFIMPKGGVDHPRAVAIYSKKTNVFKIFESEREIQEHFTNLAKVLNQGK